MSISLNGIGYSAWNNINKTVITNAYEKDKKETGVNKNNDGIKVEISKAGMDKLENGQEAGKIVAVDNKIVINDPVIEYFNKIATNVYVDANGTISWDLPSSEASKDSGAAIFKNISRDDYNFWNYLTGNPTFLGLQYSDDKVRSRLSSAGIATGFFSVTVGDRSAEQFLSQGRGAAAVYSKAQYDQHYEYITERFGKDREPGAKYNFGGKEYVLGEYGKLDIPYGEDIYDFRGSK